MGRVPGMRKWARANRRNKRRLPRCVWCKQPITRPEPDAILQDLKGELRPGHFHERCAMAAYVLVAFDEPGAWRLTHRYINPEAN